MGSKATKTSRRRPLIAVSSAFSCSSNVFVPSFQTYVDREAQKQLPRLLYLSTRNSLGVHIKDHVYYEQRLRTLTTYEIQYNKKISLFN